jgi:hypothetical protein
MSIYQITTARKYHSEAHTFEINIAIQTFKYDQLRRAVIGTSVCVIRQINAWREGWKDGHRMHRDASARWPLIDL